MKMANTNVNTGFAKCFILFMALVILLQGICYLGVSVWGITLTKKCSNEAVDITENPFQFVLKNLYFADENCGNPEIILPQINQTYTLEVNWSKSAEITNRVHILLITYAVISVLWTITSFLVVCTICCVLTKVVSAVFYWPWFLVVMCGSVLDVVATVYFAIDINHTLSVDDYFAYTGITIKNEQVSNYLKTYDAYSVTPAVVMACISARLVLIWLLNIFGTIFCLSLSNVLVKQNITATESTQYILQQQQQQSNWSDQPHQHRSTLQVTEGQNVGDSTPAPIRPKYLLNPTREAPMYSVSEFASGKINLNETNHQLHEGPPQVSTKTREASTYHKTDIHPDRLDYPVQLKATEFPTTSPELSSVSPLNQRYSNVDGYHAPNQQQRASDALRSQLPWSYTNLPAKQQTPGRRIPQTSSMYPEVPETNYPQVSQSNARERLSDYDFNRGPSQAYSEW